VCIGCVVDEDDEFEPGTTIPGGNPLSDFEPAFTRADDDIIAADFGRLRPSARRDRMSRSMTARLSGLQFAPLHKSHPTRFLLLTAQLGDSSAETIRTGCPADRAVPCGSRGLQVFPYRLSSLEPRKLHMKLFQASTRNRPSLKHTSNNRFARRFSAAIAKRRLPG
jgi:hypothetical protein